MVIKFLGEVITRRRALKRLLLVGCVLLCGGYGFFYAANNSIQEVAQSSISLECVSTRSLEQIRDYIKMIRATGIFQTEEITGTTYQMLAGEFSKYIVDLENDFGNFPDQQEFLLTEANDLATKLSSLVRCQELSSRLKALIKKLEEAKAMPAAKEVEGEDQKDEDSDDGESDDETIEYSDDGERDEGGSVDGESELGVSVVTDLQHVDHSEISSRSTTPSSTESHRLVSLHTPQVESIDWTSVLTDLKAAIPPAPSVSHRLEREELAAMICTAFNRIGYDRYKVAQWKEMAEAKRADADFKNLIKTLEDWKGKGGPLKALRNLFDGFIEAGFDELM